MDYTSLVPQADAISVHWVWFEILLIVTFVLHLLVMNAMVGTAVLSLVEHVRSRRRKTPDLPHGPAKNLTFLIAFTVNLGVAPLLFVQVIYGHLLYTSTVLMAVWWLSVVGILLVAYYAAYLYKMKLDRLQAMGPWVLGTSLVLLLLVAFFVVNAFSLAMRPEKWTEYFRSSGGLILNLDDPTLAPRYLHFLLASFAVAGLVRALWWKLKGGDGSKQNIRQGLRWFAWLSLGQAAAGLWYLFAQPERVFHLFAFDGVLQSTILWVAVGVASVMVVVAFLGRFVLSVSLFVVTVSIMAVVRELVRQATVEPFFKVQQLETIPQYSPLIMFLAVFVLGAILLTVVLKLALRPLAVQGGKL